MLTFAASANDEYCDVPIEKSEENSFAIALANFSSFLSSTNPQGRHTNTGEPLSRKVYRERVRNLPSFDQENNRYAPAPQSVYDSYQAPQPETELRYQIPQEYQKPPSEYYPAEHYGQPQQTQHQYRRPEYIQQQYSPPPPVSPISADERSVPIRVKEQPVENIELFLKPQAEPSAPAPMAIVPMHAHQEDMKLSSNTKQLLNKVPSGIGDENYPKQNIVIDRFTSPEEEKNRVGKEFEKIGTTNVQPTFQISMSDKNASQDSYEILEQALKALSVGQYESAVALYKTVLKNDPRNRDALFGVATAYHKAGQKKQARNAYGDLLKYHPNFAPGLNNLLVLASEEAPADALKELEALQQKNPNFSSIYAQKANIYMQLGDNDNAIQSLAKALKLSPEDNVYKYNLAILLDSIGNVEFSSRIYSELLSASYRGEQIPVGRKVIEDRLAYISANSPREVQ